MTRHILAVDMDNCGLILRKTDKKVLLSKAVPHLLSPDIVAFAEEIHADGFYVVTHRCFIENQACIERNIDSINHIKEFTKQELQKKQEQKPYEDLSEFPDVTDINTDDYFVSKFVENFQRATGLPCLGVSTPEDQGRLCNDGYEKFLKPHEEATLRTRRIISKPNQQDGRVSYTFPSDGNIPHVESYDRDSKNLQLRQVILSAVNQFPDEDIILYFVDDKPSIINEALQLPPGYIFNNVSLQVFWYDAFDPAIIEHKGRIKGELKIVRAAGKDQSAAASNSSSSSSGAISNLFPPPKPAAAEKSPGLVNNSVDVVSAESNALR
jgi:hypothetical protein